MRHTGYYVLDDRLAMLDLYGLHNIWITKTDDDLSAELLAVMMVDH